MVAIRHVSLTFIYFPCVYVCMNAREHACAMAHACGRQRTTCRGWFFPPSVKQDAGHRAWQQPGLPSESFCHPNN